MRFNTLHLKEIHFHYSDYDKALYDSIMRIGFSFPIKVRIDNDKYYCIDGNKRLSALSDILKEHRDYKRGDKVTIIVVNNGNTHSNDCWRDKNSH